MSSGVFVKGFYFAGDFFVIFCISLSFTGSRFGLLQTKVGLVSILGHYRVEKSSKTPDPIKFGNFGLTISIDGGLHLKLVKDP